jgi:putative endonuclease
MDAEALVFFEVRFRADGALVDPISSVSAVKQQRLVRAASFYLHRHGLWDRVSRIDVIGITPGHSSKYRIQWIKNAIQAD